MRVRTWLVIHPMSMVPPVAVAVIMPMNAKRHTEHRYYHDGRIGTTHRKGVGIQKTFGRGVGDKWTQEPYTIRNRQVTCDDKV